jgi:hypothetical protein
MSFAKKDQIFQLQNEQTFNEIALELFHYQVRNNQVYADYVRLLGRDLNAIDSIDKIPFLPISLFKSHEVFTASNRKAAVFTSSTTTGGTPSKHFVDDLKWYERVYKTAFEYFYPELRSASVFALLPSYLERTGSSLVVMAKGLMEQEGTSNGGFFLDDFQSLKDHLKQCTKEETPALLIGVTFALLDFAENHAFDLSNSPIVMMETGGMKGRRKELLREEVHRQLKKAFQLKEIHSEYGMTELLSQAYSKEKGVFECPPWMKVLVRSSSDPFDLVQKGRSGGLNIIDLANIESCAFIETADLGRKTGESTFEVLGRFDHAEVRGCNLMVANH